MRSRILLGALALALQSFPALGQEILAPVPRPTGGEAVHALKSDGPPEVRPASRAVAGDVLLALPVRHALTGVLTLDVQRDGRTVLPAGTRVFGIRNAFVRVTQTKDQRRRGVYGEVQPGGNQTTWCVAAPRDRQRRETTCMPIIGGLQRWVPASPWIYPKIPTLTPKTPMVAQVLVEPGPIEGLPPLRLAFTFAGWTPEGAKVDVTLDAGDGPAAIERRILMPGADGAATLLALDGRLRLRPVPGRPDAAEVDIVTPPPATAQPGF